MAEFANRSFSVMSYAFVVNEARFQLRNVPWEISKDSYVADDNICAYCTRGAWKVICQDAFLNVHWIYTIQYRARVVIPNFFGRMGNICRGILSEKIR